MMFKRFLSIALFVTLGLICPTNGQESSPVKSSPINRTILQRADIPGTNLELLFATVEIAAGTIKSHKLSNLTIGQVVDGEYWIQIKGQPRKTLHPGDSFTIPANAVHEEGAVGKPAKITAAYINEKGTSLINPTK